ncbi:hypothetical protein AVEN_267166-1 [Araneus ventricosus]|uniref:Uncharacterized protein n=1 Tax=Araneus ventricosus TaxID=182803 RepID=A0A4Y2LLS7_ARAVE|nr:hypothetical protein AVEN_267166-1 [Araneus ventricosus]
MDKWLYSLSYEILRQCFYFYSFRSPEQTRLFTLDFEVFRIAFCIKLAVKMSMNYNTASVSEVEDGTIQESLCSEVSKLRLKDAVIYYQGLLAQNNLISSESSASISHEAMLMGEEIFQNTFGHPG